jgi:hypothetical protein
VVKPFSSFHGGSHFGIPARPKLNAAFHCRPGLWLKSSTSALYSSMYLLTTLFETSSSM